MKILQILLLLSLLLLGESNLSSEVSTLKSDLDKVEASLDGSNQLLEFIGSVIEANTSQITNLLTMLGFLGSLFFIVFSVFGYFKGTSITKSIAQNRESIDLYKEQISKDFKEYRKEIKQEIIEEVKQQIVYGLDDAILKVQEHAYKKVEYTINDLTDEIQRRRFYYQSLIFKVNQVKKYEYEEILKQDIELESKLNKILNIQSKYNEINNHDIPRLFSKDVEGRVIPIAKKLSEYRNLRTIIIKLLLKALENDKLNYTDETQIKDVLKEYYNWEEKKE